jgi:hypothetical protein
MAVTLSLSPVVTTTAVWVQKKSQVVRGVVFDVAGPIVAGSLD